MSIICLTYNQDQFVQKTLEGLVCQETDFPFEIIIHDDASSDSTPSIIVDYQKRYPSLIRLILQKNNQYSQGVSIPILLISKARGKLIAYCEGDDYWIDPLKLQKQADLLNSNPNVGLVFTDADILFEKNGKIIFSYDRATGNPIPSGDVRNELLRGNCYRSCTAMFRADLVDGCDIIERKLKAKMGDWVMWLLISKDAFVEYIPDATVTYRVQKESASRTQSVFKSVRFLRSAHRIRRYFNKEFGMPLPVSVVDDHYRKGLLAIGVRHCRWQSILRRKRSYLELIECVVYLGAQNMISFAPCLARFARIWHYSHRKDK